MPNEKKKIFLLLQAEYRFMVDFFICLVFTLLVEQIRA